MDKESIIGKDMDQVGYIESITYVKAENTKGQWRVSIKVVQRRGTDKDHAEQVEANIMNFGDTLDIAYTLANDSMTKYMLECGGDLFLAHEKMQETNKAEEQRVIL